MKIKERQMKRKKNEKKEFLKNLKAESKKGEFECEECDECLSNKSDLKMHMLNQHVSSSSTQTGTVIYVDKKLQVKRSDFNSDKNIETSEIEFEHYPCLYCGFIIASKTHLQEHKIKCSGSNKPGFLKKSKTLTSNQPNHKESHPPDLSSLTASFSPPVGFPPPKSSQNFPLQDPRLSLHLPECEQCGWRANCGTDLVNHRKNVHNDYRNPFEIYKQINH
jgi:hypothetical protein